MMRIVLGNQTRWTTTRYDLVVRGVLTEICRHTLMLLSITRVALSTVSRCFRRSCRVDVGVVMPRTRRVSVHRIFSTLTLLMPSLWRALLTEDTMLSASLRFSLVCSS